jgi:hypothetical protein
VEPQRLFGGQLSELGQMQEGQLGVIRSRAQVRGWTYI